MSSYGRFFLSGKTLHGCLRSPENLPDQVIIWDIVMIPSAISEDCFIIFRVLIDKCLG